MVIFANNWGILSYPSSPPLSVGCAVFNLKAFEDLLNLHWIPPPLFLFEQSFLDILYFTQQMQRETILGVLLLRRKIVPVHILATQETVIS